jgi:chemotaxis protein MotB
VVVWLISYADLITNMLCFFILLYAFANARGNMLEKTMRSFQARAGTTPSYRELGKSFVPPRRMNQTEANILRHGPLGEHLNVQMLDQGKKMKIVVGGKVLFQNDDYHITSEGKRLLQQTVCPDLRGYENKIEVRGHSSTGPSFEDAWELSYRRATAVMRFLVDECGLDERRFRVVACGDTEPIKTNLTPEGREENRRVEVVMTEEFVTEREERRLP